MVNTVTPKGHGLGYVPDSPDSRDFVFNHKKAQTTTLPTSVDLRTTGFLPPVYDQAQLGSCTGNAAAAIADYMNKKEGGQWITPSRLFIYYNERVIEGTVDQDAGAEIRDAIKTLNQTGVCPESEWTYTDQGTKFKQKPPANCYTDAKKDMALAYATVPQSLTAMKTALANGLPIIIGFSVYPEFESDAVAQTGMVPNPRRGEQPIGGHAVLIVGYKKIGRTTYFIVRNSWGEGWGDKGYFYVKTSYFTNPNYANDFWVVSKTGPQGTPAAFQAPGVPKKWLLSLENFFKKLWLKVLVPA